MRSFLLRLVLLLSVGFPSLHARAIPFSMWSTPPAPSFSGEVYYVDPSFTGTETGTTTNPYKSLNAALLGKCNKTFTQPIQIRCRTSGSTADTTIVSAWYSGGMGQCVTSATNYLEIVAETGHEAGTSWDSTKYNLSPAYSAGQTSGAAINIQQSYVYLRKLQISITSQTGSAEIIYWSDVKVQSGQLNLSRSTCWADGLLVRGANNTNASYFTRGISVIYGLNVTNCIFYNLGSGSASANTCGMKVHGTSNISNTTVILNGAGIIAVDLSQDVDGKGTYTLKNVYAGGSTYHDFDVSNGTLAMTYCASADTTATGTGSLTSKAINTTNFTSVTSGGSENWSLPSGSQLRDVGTDVSGDTFPMNVTKGIRGNSRSGTYDIGADEF